ncbi:phage major tail tube protein [Endozoicomonas sp. 4G]|uniref:phage major tail tube protein n=1 Tax=Endozoicomonas sp. 4G TaxID=2872754 RepID=UPI002078D6CD|nr:phage major tail tube protein [Endozoicomonas sp. 4G]
MDSIIKNTNLFVDGVNYAGKADTLTPPVLTRLTEEYRGAGMPAPIDIDMGLERMEASWVMSDYESKVVALWCVGDPVAVVFRGAAVGQDGTTTAIVLTMRGLINVLDRGDWTPGEKPTLTVTTGLTYYQEEIGGQVLHEIDPAAYIQIVNGVDRMEQIRNALAI